MIRNEKSAIINSQEFVWRNYNAICKVCSSFIYNKRPDLMDILLDVCINQCLDRMLKVADRYNPQYSETTFIYACCTNVCRMVLKKHQADENLLTSNIQEIYENENNDESDKIINSFENGIDLDKEIDIEVLIYRILEQNNIELTDFVKDYVKYILTSEKPIMKRLFREKFEFDENGNKLMSFSLFRIKVNQIKDVLHNNDYFESVLRERIERG